ncbi:hypothetical protein FAUST_8050 [Fusarium austroamericanum]|uniref:AAA+ ATPase domain-containing protein n=1 Tax=Fusarium austroamericanum TaxID=282268 RepID=A0AAN6BXM4_FUSAU|nr:hypothetical protein FAUST_8050 [Fusarium austroamericanum]
MKLRQNPFGPVESTAARVWSTCPEESKDLAGWVIDEVMAYQGLEDVKNAFLRLRHKVEVAELQGKDPKQDNYNAVFQGNPGTGKTSIARLYGELLAALDIIPNSDDFVETSGVALAARGPSNLDHNVKLLLEHEDEPGVLFVDESYQLLSSYSGKQVLDLILKAMSDKLGRLVVIFAGYKEEMEPFFQHNPGLKSRIPYTFNFSNLTAAELWELFDKSLEDKYANMHFEHRNGALELQIAVNRLVRRSSERSFGNAREVQHFIASMHDRQAERLWNERHIGDQSIPAKRQRSCIFTRDDALGMPPSAAFTSKAWAKLQSLVGLEEVKHSVESLIGSLQHNYERELQLKQPLQVPLNRVLVGQPGTGKTTVAKLYGQILSDLGLLSRSDGKILTILSRTPTDDQIVVVKSPADFIGSHVGESEEKTMAILAATVGKVLVIDEAYMLDDGGSNSGSFKASVIDTIVANVQGDSNEDRCILLLGYEDNMSNLMRNMNPGLSRRFQASQPWRFCNFSPSEMGQILNRKLRLEQLNITSRALEVAQDMLARASTRPDFSNASQVDQCLGVAKNNYVYRLSKLSSRERLSHLPLIPEDFDPDLERRNEKCNQYLRGKLGDDIIQRLTKYELVGKEAAGQTNLSMLLPNRLVFKGPSGTGKTTAVQALSRIYYNLGLLSSSEVVQVTPMDLIGQYVGQTVPKTRKHLEKSLGKVLVIDRASSLGRGQYGNEALEEILQFISGLSYLKTIVIVLSDSTKDIDVLFKEHPSLQVQFEEEIVFSDLLPDDCIVMLSRELATLSFQIQDESPLKGQAKLRDSILRLQQATGFQNAKDVKTLARKVAAKAFELNVIAGVANSPRMTFRESVKDSLGVTYQVITKCVHEMTEQRRALFLTNLQIRTNDQIARAKHTSLLGDSSYGLIKRADAEQDTNQATEDQSDQQTRVKTRAKQNQRVSTFENRNMTREGSHGAAQQEETRQCNKKQQTDGDSDNIQSAKATESDSQKREKKSFEDSKISEAEEVKVELSIKEMGDLREKEEEALKRKCHTLKLCPAGFAWRKVGTEFHCEGGSHSVSVDELRRM